MFKIGLVGKAGSGKDTAAKVIKKHLLFVKTIKLAFADPVKKIVKTMFPKVKHRDLFGPSKFRNEIIEGAFDENGNPLTIRKALLYIGTSVGRKYNPNCWIDNMNSRINKASNKYDCIIITDCRFPNEFDALKKQDFFMINVIRDNENKINHVSETTQDTITNFDFVIDNNGTLSDLENLIEKQLLPALYKTNNLTLI